MSLNQLSGKLAFLHLAEVLLPMVGLVAWGTGYSLVALGALAIWVGLLPPLVIETRKQRSPDEPS